MTLALTNPPPNRAPIVDHDGTKTTEFHRWLLNAKLLFDASELNMTTSVSQLFAPTLLTTLAATLFTVASSPNSAFTAMLRKGRVRFTNVTAGAITVKAYAIPKGGTASDTGNAFLVGFSIAANSFSDVDLPQMKAGDFLQALASANTSIMCTALDGILYT